MNAVLYSENGRRWLNAGLVVVVLLVIWEALYLYAGEVALRSPWGTLVYVIDLLQTRYFWDNALDTIRAFLFALALAIGFGLGFGLWLGFHKASGLTLTPVLLWFAAVPKITLYPIILLAFGLGIGSKVVFGAIHGIVPIAIFTIGALSTIRPVLLKVGKSLRLSPLETVRTILVPAALPEIFTGIRVGFSFTLIGTVLGEMFASQRGLGFMLVNAIGLHNVDLIMAITVLLTVVAATFSIALLAIDRKLRRRISTELGR